MASFLHNFGLRNVNTCMKSMLRNASRKAGASAPRILITGFFFVYIYVLVKYKYLITHFLLQNGGGV